MTFEATEPPFRFRMGTRPLLISMPHVGTYVPPSVFARLTDEAQYVQQSLLPCLGPPSRCFF